MLILNTGGTFNKRYNPLNGELEVPFDNWAIEDILENVNFGYNLAGIVYKDSLDMQTSDRKMIADIILHSKEDTFIIVHGTDTMHITAEFLDEIFDNKKIILTGAMKPYELQKSEASLNLGIALGYARAEIKNGVYICMSGFIENWKKINKNRDIGKFELVR